MKVVSARIFSKKLSGFVLGVACLLSAANASASLIGVKTIEISNSINEWLQVAEFQAFDLDNVNVALDATASSLLGSAWNAESTPDKAIDGNTNGVFGANSMYHEGNSDFVRVGDTLVISLLSATDLGSIAIFGRTDCCSNRDVYNLNFLDDFGASIFTIAGLDATGANNNRASFQFPAASVPEPGMLGLFGLGLTGLAFLRRRRSAKA